jgi:hypothetical protein
MVNWLLSVARADSLPARATERERRPGEGPGRRRGGGCSNHARLYGLLAALDVALATLRESGIEPSAPSTSGESLQGKFG